MADRVVRVTLAAQVADYNASMMKAAQATKTVGTEAEKLAQKRQAFEQLGRTMFTAGGVMAAGVGLAVKRFADFDQAMSNVAATGEDARASMDALRQAAIEAGARTVFSATESANAIEEMAKAGVDAADILGGGLNGALDLAAAGGLGVAEAAGIAATALKVFNLEGSDMGHVADLLAAGAGKAMGDVTDLSAALAQGGQVAAATGLSIEETTAALSAFASQGLLGSDAGTSLKTMLQRLNPTTKEAQAQFEALGVSAYDTNGQFVGLADFAGQLQTSMADLSPEARNAAMAVMFGSDAVRAANVLYKEGEQGIRNWTSAVDDQGYAARTAETRLDNLKGDVEALGGAFDSALISMGEGANGPLRYLTQSLTELVDGFNGLPDWAQQTALGVGALGAAAALTGGAFFLAVPKIAEFNTALATMGPGAQRAGRGLANLARAGALAATIGMVTVGVNELSSAIAQNFLPTLDEVDARTRRAQSGVELFAAALYKEGVTNAKDAGMLLGNLGDELDKVADSSFWKPASTSGTAATVAKQLAEIAKSGDMDAFSQQFRRLGEDAELTDRQMRTFIRANPELQDALLQQASAAGAATDIQSLLTFAMGQTPAEVKRNTDELRELQGQAESTGDEVEGLADQIRAFGSATLDTREARRSFEQSFDDLTDSIKENGKSLDVSTQKGRDNQAALDEAASSTFEYAAAVYEQTGSQEKANDVIAAGRDRLIDMLGQLGITGDKAQAYADRLGMIPDNINTAVRIETDAAQGSINRLISNNNGRRITLNVVTNESTVTVSGGRTATSRAEGGAISGPGTGTSDSIPAMLSNGEHVLTAAEVQAAGGHDAIYAWREALRGNPVKRFASGGKVSYAIDRSTVVDWSRQVRRGDARRDGMGGNALSLVDKLFDIAADIGGKYGARLRADALRSEKVFTRLEKKSDEAARTLDKAKDKLSDLRDAASSMASRVSSAVRSFFNVADLATSKTVTTGSSSTRVVNGITVAGAGVTTTQQDATTAKSIASSMKKDASAIKRFARKLKRLAAKGIRPGLLEEIASLGIEQGEPIVDALLDASKSEIRSINSSYDAVGHYSDMAGGTVADANYEKLIESAEKQVREARENADAIREQLRRETAKIIKGITDAVIKGSNTKVQKKAAGGPIYGPGTSTSDSIPALLSNGENVWSAADVQRHGGQAQVEQLKRLQPTLPRFANGGPVGFGAAPVGPVSAVVTLESARLIAAEVAARTGSAVLSVRAADAQDAVMSAARGVR